MADADAAKEGLRRLPAVHRLLELPRVEGLIQHYGRPLVTGAASRVLDELRGRILAGETPPEEELDLETLARRLAEELARREQPNFRRVINGTGVVIHTNLGRSLLLPEAEAALATAARRYSNLEFDLEQGERGSRYAHVEGLLRELTGAEAAMVVNNNAAAVLLVLSALAAGGEVIVSRGQMVEIGGSFRIPDVMAQSGARLVEVGTTNKTHRRDYEQAITENTALLLKVHTSNYRIIGFTAEVGLPELVALGREHGIPVVEDLGSGSLVDLTPYGLPPEPTVPDVIATGIDLVTFSGDKLLGGPQAGIICGRREWVERCRRHPLNRAVRIDKFTVAALEATLLAYRNPEHALRRIPTLKMLTTPADELARRAEQLAESLAARLAKRAEIAVQPENSQVGGGAMPEALLPTSLVTVRPLEGSAQVLADRLRRGEPPVVGRLIQDALAFDPRTLLPGDEEEIAELLEKAL